MVYYDIIVNTKLYIYSLVGKEETLAISSLLPRKTMKNRSRKQFMLEQNKYDQKAEKTNGGELISSYMCSPETAAEEFEISKKIYAQITGRSQSKEHDVIMYRIIQSSPVSKFQATKGGSKSSLYRVDLNESGICSSSIREAKVVKNTCWRT